MSSMWETVKKRLCHVFSPVATKMHAATRIHSRPQVASETPQEYIQRFTDLVLQAVGTNSTPVTCQVAIILLIRHFNKEIRKPMTETKTI